MNLIIDVGNTFVKLAVFDDNNLIFKKKTELKFLTKSVNFLNQKHPQLTHAIISSVGKINENHLTFLRKHYQLMELTHKTKLPFNNNYATPNTLGIDRIALVCASVYHYSKNNALIIDAGTCITYDFITKKNDYLGGAISPGIRMRYKALNNLTANLPLLETEKPKQMVGDSTNNAIHSGVVYGVLNEIDGFILDYKEKHSDLTVILTGGDAKFLSKQLKSSIFANSNFLLEGLNYILQFNINQ